jgi:hypothetical protein
MMAAIDEEDAGVLSPMADADASSLLKAPKAARGRKAPKAPPKDSPKAPPKEAPPKEAPPKDHSPAVRRAKGGKARRVRPTAAGELDQLCERFADLDPSGGGEPMDPAGEAGEVAGEPRRGGGGVAGAAALLAHLSRAFGEDAPARLDAYLKDACRVSIDLAAGRAPVAARRRAQALLQAIYVAGQALSSSLVAARQAGVLRAQLPAGGEQEQECGGEQQGREEDPAGADQDPAGADQDPAGADQDPAGADQERLELDAQLAASLQRCAGGAPGEDGGKQNPLQQLLLHLLECAEQRGYRRVGDACYRPRPGPDGQDTHAWERHMSVREFVYDATRKETHWSQWANLTAMRGNVASAVEHLCGCRDTQFPDLVRDRKAFAFRNGVYLADKDAFLPYGGKGHAALPASLAAAKYFDQDFLDPPAPCPAFQSILDFQGMGPECCFWMYAMVGRLLYPLNELDSWQVIPFLKGAASSGKSTILMGVCRRLYEPGDVGVLSNNIEKKFGLSALADKFLFVAPEIRGTLELEQAEFQSLVSGESIQVAAKYKTSATVDWRVPGILAGNEAPAWVDNAGSINRRILIFAFPNQVTDGDMELGKKLEAELPAILCRANRAYREAARKWSRSNIWRHLPPEFQQSKDELTESVNSVAHFLRSGALDFGPDLYMPLDHFAALYNAHCQAHNLRKVKLQKEALQHPLLALQCRLVKKATHVYPRMGLRIGDGVPKSPNGENHLNLPVADPQQEEAHGGAPAEEAHGGAPAEEAHGGAPAEEALGGAPAEEALGHQDPAHHQDTRRASAQQQGWRQPYPAPAPSHHYHGGHHNPQFAAAAVTGQFVYGLDVAGAGIPAAEHGCPAEDAWGPFC